MATVQKRGNSYRLRASCGYDSDGKQLMRSMTWTPTTGMTQKQIDKELERQKVLFDEQCGSGQYISGSIKFSDFIEVWFKDYANAQLQPKTLEEYKRLTKRLNIALGHIKLNKLQPNHIIQFYNNLQESGIRNDKKYIANAKFIQSLSSTTLEKQAEQYNICECTIRSLKKGNSTNEKTAIKITAALDVNINELFDSVDSDNKLSNITIRHYHKLLSSILNTAVQWQMIISNPVERVKAPKVEHKEVNHLDDIQAMNVIEILENEPIKYKTAISLLIYSGLRRGELCGLKWSDADLQNEIITVKRATQYIKGMGLFEKVPKNESSVRVIKLPTIMIDMLKEYKKWQNTERLKMGDRWESTDFIFTKANGTPTPPDTITGYFNKFVKKYNLPKGVNVHSLRHTNASLLIAGGVSVRTVSQRLGHAQTSTTMNIYAHSIKTADEIASNTLQNVLNPFKVKNEAL